MVSSRGREGRRRSRFGHSSRQEISPDGERAPVEITLGVLLEDGTQPSALETDGGELDETGHAPATGRRGRHRGDSGNRVAELGEDVLRAAAEAVGREVALVVASVVTGMTSQVPGLGGGTSGTGELEIGDMELKFGVKAMLGTGKVEEALLTASGEATVEVTLKLARRA